MGYYGPCGCEMTLLPLSIPNDALVRLVPTDCSSLRVKVGSDMKYPDRGNSQSRVWGSWGGHDTGLQPIACAGNV